MLRPGEVLIHDGNFHQFLSPVVAGETKARGLKPRNYQTHPVGFYSWAKAVDFPLIPQTEWSARLTDMIANKSQLSDIRLTGNAGQIIPSRDQNGKGYCWAHSSTSNILVMRAVNGDPYADLSAYAVACIIKGYADEGGWGAESMDWIIKNGIPTAQFWPQQSMSRSNDNPAMRANALLHKVTDQWADLNTDEGSRSMTFQQVATLLLSRNPCVTDFNWWSHSVCGIDLVDGATAIRATRTESGKLATLQEFDAMWAMNDPVTAGFGLRIWNSWGDSWSDRGMGVLAGSKAIPDGCVAPRLVLPSEN